MTRVVVVGAGVTGLAVGWTLQRRGADVVVVDPAREPGGKLRTVVFDGAPFDVGADAFVARRPEGRELAVAAGLGADLVPPARSAVWVARDGRLRRAPPRTLFGVPTDLRALVRNRTLSPAGRARALVEPLLPATPAPPTVGALVRGRLGDEAAETLVAPLLAGIYAGDIDRLGLEDAAPQLAAAARADRSLVRGARRTLAAGATGRDPVFLTVRGGMGRLAAELAAPLERLVAPAQAIEPGDRWTVHTPSGAVAADHVVVTAPTDVAASLLAPTSRRAADALAWLGSTPYASVATVALAYAWEAAPGRPRASGVLVPAREGYLVKAVTIASAKWPQHRGQPRLLLRASVGRVDDERFRTLPDDDLAQRVDAEVRGLLGLSAEATDALVQRWPRSLPQYRPGHLAAVDRVRRAAPAGLHLAGAGYGGVGVTPCIAQAVRVADAVTGGVAGDG